MKARLPVTRILILCNSAFWVIFSIYFASHSYDYKPHPIVFEEWPPRYIVMHRAFPFDQYTAPFMRLTRALQWPSFRGATPFNRYFSERGITIEHMYGASSVGGYYLICVFLISFLQWSVAGVTIDAGIHYHGKTRRSAVVSVEQAD